jgi:hypothetical protein
MSDVSETSLVILGNRGGRPPRAGQRSTRRIEFVVTPDEYADLEKVAADHQQPIAAIIRQAVNEFVADYRETKVFAK